MTACTTETPSQDNKTSSRSPADEAAANISAGAPKRQTVLQLLVNNHPGVMAHVCGLFSRRAFNVEGILCMPVGHGEKSRIWLLVHDDHRLEQMTRQVQKLHDVIDIERKRAEHEAFVELEKLFRGQFL